MMNYFGGYGAGFSGPFQALGPWAAIIPILALWSLFWKGLALWHSARRGEHIWYIVLLVVNTVGILEIIYLFGVLKLKWADLFQRN